MKLETKIKVYVSTIFWIALSITAFFLMGWKAFLGMFLFMWAERIVAGTREELKTEKARTKLIKDLKMGLYKQQE